MRTTKQERRENALRFYNLFLNSNCNNAAIVVLRFESKTNPNVNRCIFWAVPSIAFMDNPVVIAESNFGINGCFCELLNNIKPCKYKSCFDIDFNEWLMDTYGIRITYRDGLVFMLEK